MFLSTLVLDGQVRGTWTRTVRAASVHVTALPFTRLAAADRKGFVEPAERYADFLGVPVDLRWATRDG